MLSFAILVKVAAVMALVGFAAVVAGASGQLSPVFVRGSGSLDPETDRTSQVVMALGCLLWGLACLIVIAAFGLYSPDDCQGCFVAMVFTAGPIGAIFLTAAGLILKPMCTKPQTPTV